MNGQRMVHPIGWRWTGTLFILAVTQCNFSWEPSFDEDVDPAVLETVEIAETGDALTFARYLEGGARVLIIVTAYRDGVVTGVEVDESPPDPISLFNAFDYEEIQAMVDSGETVQRSAEELIMPVDLKDHHIAAGTNYAEHADEAGVKDGPYLFPKLVEPTPWNADVSVSKGLLDYEVELAFVPLKTVRPGDEPDYMGLILCNDYTDRETLLKHLDVENVASGDGFTTGKSFPGYLPVGNLFVIPRDYRAFADRIELQLYVNHALRQRAKVSFAIWDIDALLRQVWLREETTWEHRGEQVSLFSGARNEIESSVLIMSGTPYGVVFNEVTTEQKGTGFFDWLFGGWDKAFSDYAIDDYITDARAEGIYLMTGDQVDIHVHNMGVIRNEIVK